MKEITKVLELLSSAKELIYSAAKAKQERLAR